MACSAVLCEWFGNFFRTFYILEWEIVRWGVCGGDYGSSRSGLGSVGRSWLLGGGCCRGCGLLLWGVTSGGLGISALLRGVVGALAQELEGIHNYLRGVALVAGLVLPLAGAETALDIHLGAFPDIFFRYVGVVAPGNYVVPFRVFTDIAAAVTVSFRGCQGEGGYFGVCSCILGIGFKVTYFRVFSNVTDKHYFIQ